MYGAILIKGTFILPLKSDSPSKEPFASTKNHKF